MVFFELLALLDRMVFLAKQPFYKQFKGILSSKGKSVFIRKVISEHLS
jgi:hypothetical protein